MQICHSQAGANESWRTHWIVPVSKRVKMPSREELISTMRGYAGRTASNIAGDLGAPGKQHASICHDRDKGLRNSNISSWRG